MLFAFRAKSTSGLPSKGCGASSVAKSRIIFPAGVIFATLFTQHLNYSDHHTDRAGPHLVARV